MDFTLLTYQKLLISFQEKGIPLLCFSDYLENPLLDKFIILRHDVDRFPVNALRMAEIESQLCIKGTYFFRSVKHTYRPSILERISNLGHEIGYHYEDFSNARGNLDKAIRTFGENLDRMREYYPVRTICMHGSPLSKYDNRDLWSSYRYSEFNIAGEPYFDIDFSRVFYLTETGRHWNKQETNVRDKISLQKENISIKNTNHLMELLRKDILPGAVMLNVHPHRWNSNIFKWLYELINQNLRNIVKYFIVKLKKSYG